MDIDTTEFRRYLDNGADFTLQPPPPNRASRASNAGLCVIESSITAGIEANEGDPRREEDIDASAVAGGAGTNSGVMQPPSAIDDHVMAGAANLDEIVNSNELRRRSQANVFGVDSLYLEDGPSFMVPSGGAYSSAPMSAAMMSVLPPTTMEDLMDMGATTADLGMFTFSGGMPSAGDIQSAVSMFADQSGIAPSPHPSPVITHLARGSSVHSSPVGPSLMGSSGNMRPRTLLARNPTMSSISSLPEAGLPGEEIENSSPMPMDTRLDQNTSVPMSGVTNEGQINEPIVSKTTSLFPQNIYSSSGFDMLDILRRVATRPNPEINIGAVDMSCAFVVTDQRKYDNPIVYCSATFERLTGYTKHEVLGRNCRFLQAPDGQIKSGDKRKYVDENAVFYLKAQIKNKNEAQTSLINYRKGGQSFTNLLTMIPITYNSDDVVYYVGFQVDLVDQPGAMMNRNQGKDGSYAVNYQYSQLPTYMPAASMLMDQGPRLTVGRDDVSQVLASFGAGDSELHSKRIMDKVLLENTDDVVHVLSLKGLFLYCSPSIRKVLEYEPHELVGTSLSGVCHPSDIVPVTRDLKDTSAGSTVNVVFRIRRKHSGYTWFESHGCLHTEQGKGRKCIILVGRERPVYVLQTRDVQANGGIGENELWTKMSTSGMFLYVSSNVKALLDRDGEELTGTSVQALMRSDAKNEVGKALEVARQGKKTTVRHELQNKRGQFLQALTTLFPGDGNDLSTPTFLVAQTRLLKHSRQSSSTNTKVTNSTPETATSSHASTPSVWSAATQSTQPTTSGERSKSAESKESDQAVGDDNMFEELKTTRSTSWQFELRQMQRTNKRLTEELNALLTSRKKRKRRKGADQLEKDCANCHTRTTPEWRRGPSGKRDLCNSCGLRYAKLQKVNRGSSRNGGTNSEKSGCSPLQTTSPMTMQSLAVELSPMNPTPTPTLTQPQLHPISESTPPHQPNGMLKADVGGSEPASPVAGKPPFQQISGARRGSMGNLPITPKQRHQVIHSRRGSMPSSSTASTLTPGHSSTASMPTSHLNNSTTYNDGGGDGGG